MVLQGKEDIDIEYILNEEISLSMDDMPSSSKKRRLKTQNVANNSKRAKQSAEAHICDRCKCKCRSERKLQTHMKKVHGLKKEFQCEKCGFGFSQLGELQQHWSKEHKPKEYICKYCERQCKNKDGLRKHIKSNHPIEFQMNKVSNQFPL